MTGVLHIAVPIQLNHLETLGTATNVETLVDCRLPSIITDDKVTCGIFTKALEKVSGPLVRSK